MKTVVLGLTIGVLGLLGLLQLQSEADATCGGCGQMIHLGGFPSDLDVNNNSERKFTDEGFFAWCITDGQPSLISIEFDSAESADVHDVTLTPSLVSGPQPCSGNFAVTVEGFLDDLDDVGTCVIDALLWPPTLTDEQTITVHET